MQTKQEKETDEKIAVLVTNLSLLALRLFGYAYAVTEYFGVKFISSPRKEKELNFQLKSDN